MSDNTEAMQFKGHNHIKVLGDAGAPARMWDVTLYTDPEFDALTEKEKDGVVPMRESHRHLVEKHFGK
tara:strand:+ start:5859 stop:6062 length:204 start_codon:yes stop_codon:yes gene_type:complete